MSKRASDFFCIQQIALNVPDAERKQQTVVLGFTIEAVLHCFDSPGLLSATAGKFSKNLL